MELPQTVPDRLPSIEKVHVINHHEERDYLCKYCVREKLEQLDNQLPPPNEGEKIMKP